MSPGLPLPCPTARETNLGRTSSDQKPLRRMLFRIPFVVFPIFSFRFNELAPTLFASNPPFSINVHSLIGPASKPHYECVVRGEAIRRRGRQRSTISGKFSPVKRSSRKAIDFRSENSNKLVAGPRAIWRTTYAGLQSNARSSKYRL